MDAASAQPPPRAFAGLRSGAAGVRAWPAKRWLVALLGAMAAALVIGVPTGVVPTSFYTRMTAVTWWDYPVWALSAVLIGLTAATYVSTGAPQREVPDRSRRTAGATLLSTFAVGCPICNKLIVALIGVGGAASYWAPLQPILGVLNVGLLGTGLALRVSGGVVCQTATPA